MATGRHNRYVQPGTVGLLYIEPQFPPCPPSRAFIDEAVMKMQAAMRRAVEGRDAYRGMHVCSCGARSSNTDYVIDGKFTTNSLAVHYLERHREEVPVDELADVLALPDPPALTEYREGAGGGEPASRRSGSGAAVKPRTLTIDDLRDGVRRGAYLVAAKPIRLCVHNGRPVGEETHIISGDGVVEACTECASGATLALHARWLRVDGDGEVLAVGVGRREHIAWTPLLPFSGNRRGYHLFNIPLIVGCVDVFAVRLQSPRSVVAEFEADLYVREADVRGASGMWAEVWAEARRARLS